MVTYHCFCCSCGVLPDITDEEEELRHGDTVFIFAWMVEKAGKLPKALLHLKCNTLAQVEKHRIMD